CYMVTFKKVDPLFVIDLSEPTNPKVLGKLKIPGYSDYLHPIDETHILGLGKDTIESTYGDFAWYQGIKMAVFDVSDPENPKEMYKTVIGDRGTDSYALQDHKAFLFDKEKELLVIPITLAEIPEEQKKETEQEMRSPAYGEQVFQGAFVFNVSLENGISEKGRITHVSAEEELKRGYYYGGQYSVKRSFYIGEALYTFSDSMLKANDLGTLQEISSVPLSAGGTYYGGYE
ncbi:MAG: beta-propeller domain-containing protein, partial [Candidatus Diapherotrites archaeon]